MTKQEWIDLLKSNVTEFNSRREAECFNPINLTDAVLTGANLTRADLTGADLTGADLTDAVLTDAVLTDAVLTGAVLTGADLTDADLPRADLTDAVLTGANLRGANLDFSCWPLWCGSFGAIADDRLVAQLSAHLARLDDTHCSDEVKAAMAEFRKSPLSNLFCTFRDDVKPI